jgi:hypothetical protein
MLQLPEVRALTTLTADGRLLFATRMVRLFAYGFLAVILGLYLAQIGMDDTQIGLLLSVTHTAWGCRDLFSDHDHC